MAEEVVHGERFACARHADENSVLRRTANEGANPGQVSIRAVIDRLGFGQMRREGGRERKQIGQIPILGVKVAVPVTAAGPAGPSGKEELLRGRRQRHLIDLRTVHLVNRVLDRGAFGVKSGFGLVPDPDEILDVEREGKSLGERIDFPFLLFEGDGKGVLSFGLVIAAQAVDGLFLAGDFLPNRDRFQIDRNLIIEKRERRQPVNDAGVGFLGPAFDGKEGVVVSIEVERGFIL